ncbi:MAG: hypothetical protein AAF360_16195 [Pseudomonadota bacterium]
MSASFPPPPPPIQAPPPIHAALGSKAKSATPCLPALIAKPKEPNAKSRLSAPSAAKEFLNGAF